MDPDLQGVPADSPPADEPSASPAAAVSAVDPEQIVDDRPLKNIIAELKRQQQQQFDDLAARLIAAQAPRPAPQAPQSREYSDEELAQLAAAGDARAHDMLTDRKAQRYAAQHVQAATQQQQEFQALSLLMTRYPVLRDDTHELTRYAAQAKFALMRQGHPDSPATISEAIRIAIADNPELAAQALVRPVTPASVPRATVPTAAAASPAPRRPAPQHHTPGITDEQWKLAKRYGYKTREDAARAIANQQRRSESGQSRLGSVAAFIREDA